MTEGEMGCLPQTRRYDKEMCHSRHLLSGIHPGFVQMDLRSQPEEDEDCCVFGLDHMVNLPDRIRLMKPKYLQMK